MRVIVLTSTFLRHQFLVNTVAAGSDLRGVWQEQKPFAPLSYVEDAAEEQTIAGHFTARDESEVASFGAHRSLQIPEGGELRLVGPGGCNDTDEIVRMRAHRPDVVIVFGTGILRDELIAAFSGRIINVHLGLSPYYRGAGTNFWPLVNREPEYVGATIHYLDAGIDTGPIICHVRPAISRGDGPHDIGNRTIESAAQAVVAAARAHVDGRVRRVPQRRGGRLYLRKHFNAEAVRQLYENFRSGMIEDYLAARTLRDAPLSLVALETAG